MRKKYVLQVVLVITLLSFPLTAFATPGDPPTVTTIGSSTSDGVTLQGETTYDGVSNYGFEYGETTDYGKSVSGEEELSQYSFLGSFGSNGSGDGQFSQASSMAIDSTGNMFVIDTNSGRFQKFDSDGQFISQFGTFDYEGTSTAPGMFKYPEGIVIDGNDNIYVANTYKNHIDKYDKDFNLIRSFGGWGPGTTQFRNPSRITFDSSNNIYITDVGYSRANAYIKKYDQNGNFLQRIGTYGSGDGQLSYPRGIAVANNGDITVVDSGNNRIQKFDSSGQYLSQFGSYGSGDGQFNSPGGLTVDESGNIYVADTYNHRIQKFDSDGNYLSQFGSYGDGNRNLIYPRDVILNSTGEILVVDTGHFKIKTFSHSDTTAHFSAKAIDLNCETTYHYRAFATNTNGTSYGEDQTFTTGDCSDVVTNLSGVPTPTSVRISWDTDTQDGYWQIAYRPTSSTEWHSVNVYDSTSGKIQGLEPSTEYVFRSRNSQNGNSETWGLWSAPFVTSTLALQDYEISTCQELQDIGWNPATGETGDLEGNYKLTQDIDCAETSTWNEEPIDLGYMGLNISGFVPIGNFDFEANDMLDNAFLGNFDGQGHTISNLYQRGSSYMNGLFALTYRSEIKNLTLDGLNIELTKAQGYVGGLAGATIETTIDNVHVNGQIVSVDEGVSKYSPNCHLIKTFQVAEKLYASTECGTIVALNSDGSAITTLKNLDTRGEFSLDSLGNIYALSQDNSSVVKYDQQGNELTRFAQGDSNSIYGVEVANNDTVYVNGNDLDLYSTDGELLQHVDVDTNSTGSEQKFAVGANGEFYIANYGELYKYNSAGENLGQIGTSGSNEGQFGRISGLSIASNDNLYVLDSDNERTSIISPNGEFINSFSMNPQNDDGRPEIYSLHSIIVASDGSIYFTAARNLIHLTANGDYLDTLTEESIGMLFLGGFSGFSYSEDLSPTTIIRSSNNVDIDLDIKDQEMAFISGGIDYGTADIVDSLVTGNISVQAQGVEMLGVAGLTTYNMGGNISRSYYSGDIDVESDGMVIAGGLATYGLGMELKDNFFTGNISLDTPMGIASGIGAYLMGGEFDDNDEFMPLVLENNKFDQSQAGTDICAFVMDENEEPMAVDESGCGAVNTDGNDSSYFLGNHSAAPLDKWDFEDVWQTNNNALPTLRTVVIENETPVDDTDPDSGNGNDTTDLPPDNTPSKKQVSLNDLLPSDSNNPSASTPAETEVSPLAPLEKSKDDLLKVLGEEKTKDGNSAALKALIPEKSSKFPISPQLLAISTITMLGAALAFGKWYPGWKKTTELVTEKPNVFQGWK